MPVGPDATSQPEPPQSPLPLEDLRITSEVTGQDLVARISAPEVACLTSAMGDANFLLFQGAPLMAAAGNEEAKSLFVGCLEEDILPVLGVRLISAHLDGWSEDSLECVTDLSSNHPELIYVALGVESDILVPSHPTKVHSVPLDMYECLGTPERVRILHTITSNTYVATPFSGQHFLDALPEAEVECLPNSLPEPVFAIIANAPSVAGGERRDAPPQMMACFSVESLSRIAGEVLAHNMGVTSDDSHACVIEFSLTHGHYVELARKAAADPTALTPEEYLELAEDGWKLFNCMTEEALALFQRSYLPHLVP